MIALCAALALATPVDGTVRVRGNGDPVEGATVSVGDVSATTGPDGRFTLDLPDGSHTVLVRADAFAPLDAPITVPGEASELFVESRPPFTIVVEAFKATPHVARHVVDAEMALETPGTYEDSFRLVQSLPGVTVQREYAPGAGDLSVRGSAPGDNRYFLDGIEIPYLYHFNQYASVFPTSQIATLELYPSAYGAAYGDAVGAVVEAESQVARPARAHGGAHLNLVAGGADLAVPLGKTWWVQAAGRRSYQDLFGEQTAQYTLWPIFHDYALRAGTSSATRQSQVFLWGAGDRYIRAAGELDVLDPVEAEEAPSFDYRRAFEVLGASHRWEGETSGRFVGAVVHDRLLGELTGGARQDQRTGYVASRLDLAHRWGAGWELAGGWELRGELMELEVVDAGDLGVLVAEEAPALARGEPVDALAARMRSGVYGNWTAALGDVRLMTGLRLASDTRTHPLFVEPRLAVRWKPDDETGLKLAAGLYHQVPETEHLLRGTGDPHLAPTRAWQLAGGIEHTYSRRWEVSLDGYGKWLENVLVQPVDGPAEVAGKGFGWGVEVLTRYRLREYFFLWGWVAVSRTTVTDGRRTLPADGDQPVVGGVVASWDVAPGWNVGLRYRFGSGLPYTPVAEGLYDGTNDAWSPVPGPENSARMPDYHKVDLHAARTWELRRWSLTVSADVWWVPKSSAQLYPTWSYDFSEEGYVIGPTLLPLVGVRAKF